MLNSFLNFVKVSGKINYFEKCSYISLESFPPQFGGCDNVYCDNDLRPCTAENDFNSNPDNFETPFLPPNLLLSDIWDNDAY